MGLLQKSRSKAWIRTRIAAWITTMVVMLMLSACGDDESVITDKKKDQSIVTECSIPADQSASITGHWLTVPVPLAFRSDSFTSTQIAEIAAGIDIWNVFFKASKNIGVLKYGTTSEPTLSSNSIPAQICSKSITTTADYSGKVVIYKHETWPAAYSSSAIAITSVCPRSASPYDTLFMAIMEINYDNFFTAGQKQPDLRSVVLHEMGHLLGLGHSCEDGSFEDGMPDCSNPSIEADYTDAVMYPSIDGDGAQKRELKRNDMTRANCLY